MNERLNVNIVSESFWSRYERCKDSAIKHITSFFINFSNYLNNSTENSTKLWTGSIYTSTKWVLNKWTEKTIEFYIFQQRKECSFARIYANFLVNFSNLFQLKKKEYGVDDEIKQKPAAATLAISFKATLLIYIFTKFSIYSNIF